MQHNSVSHIVTDKNQLLDSAVRIVASNVAILDAITYRQSRLHEHHDLYCATGLRAPHQELQNRLVEDKLKIVANQDDPIEEGTFDLKNSWDPTTAIFVSNHYYKGLFPTEHGYGRVYSRAIQALNGAYFSKAYVIKDNRVRTTSYYAIHNRSSDSELTRYVDVSDASTVIDPVYCHHPQLVKGYAVRSGVAPIPTGSVTCRMLGLPRVSVTRPSKVCTMVRPPAVLILRVQPMVPVFWNPLYAGPALLLLLAVSNENFRKDFWSTSFASYIEFN